MRPLLPSWLAIVLCCLAPALQPYGSAQQPPEPSTPDQTAASEQQLLDEAAQIGRQIASIRGLELRREIKKGIRNRDQLRRVLIQKLAEEISDVDIEAEGKVYKHLGLMNTDIDYKQMLLDVLTEQIAGFYDQHAEELYIMRGIPLSLQRPAMAHEIYHAIQDQHFDIEAMTEPISSQENGDFSLARSALIEGDATVLMIDFTLYEEGALPQRGVSSVVDIPMMANMLAQLSMQDLGALQSMVPQSATPSTDALGPADLGDTALSKAPRLIRKLLIFPYFGGMRFIIAARSGATWERVDDIYANPPVSTEQILHPERYFDYDDPVYLSLDTLNLLDQHSPTYDTVMGEYQMRLIAEEHLLDEEAADPAIQQRIDDALTGWDGDRLIALEDADGQLVTAHLSVWDTTEDAVQYYDLLQQVAQARFPDATSRTASGAHGQSTCYRLGAQPQGERVYIEQWGDMVLQIAGTPSSLDTSQRETDPTTYLLRDRIWATVERIPFSAHLAENVAKMHDDSPTPKSDTSAPQ